MIQIHRQSNLPHHEALAHELSALANAAYQEYVAVMGKKPAPMEADYAMHLTKDEVFVALDVDVLIGFAILMTKPDGYWLETIAVDKAYRGQGIGGRLIEAVEAYLAPIANTYQLYTNEKMTKAQSWYITLGFVETDQRHEAGFARIYYRKSL